MKNDFGSEPYNVSALTARSIPGADREGFSKIEQPSEAIGYSISIALNLARV